MTSSLVGSEMCIRDRLRTIREWRALLPRAQYRAHNALLPNKGTVHLPVSYTHLTLPTICSV
eukprot:12403701-Prorocentrum_lima.AAC.1